MRAYEIGAQQGLGGLRLVERTDPVPSPGEALIRVSAVCLNHRDLLILEGRYGARKDEARIPCSDGVGVVEALGEGAKGIAIGDRVICPHFVGWQDGAFDPAAFGRDLGVTRDGWLAERAVRPASALVKVPRGRDDRWAAPLPSAGGTAWNALGPFAQLRAGETVLLLGTGGVSIFALQIAKLKGARIAITSSSDDKLAAARAMGAEITVNYAATSDWPAAIVEAAGGRGADVIVDTAGYMSLSKSIAAAAPNGRIALIGALSGPPSEGIANFSAIVGKNLTLKGIASASREMLAALVEAFDSGGIDPVVDKRVFPFDDAPAAYRYLQSGGHFGKVMITL